MNHLKEKNRKNLLKEFAIRHPYEVYKFCNIIKDYKHGKINIYMEFNSPPDYYIGLLNKGNYKRFYTYKFNMSCRRIFSEFMESYLLDKNPSLKYVIEN